MSARPAFFCNFRHFQRFDCDQHNLSSYTMIVLHLLPFYSRNKFLNCMAAPVPYKKKKLNILVSGVRHYCMSGLFAISWFPVSCSPAQFQSSCTSWQTSLLLNECGAPSAQCVMPVGNNLRLPMHLISIERAYIWKALHATLSMMDPLEPTWWLPNEWRCPPPCCKSWRLLDENTV